MVRRRAAARVAALCCAALAGAVDTEASAPTSKEELSKWKWEQLAHAKDIFLKELKMVMRDHPTRGQVPGFDSPSIYPDEIFDPGGSVMLGAWDFHYTVQLSINRGVLLIVRFVNSDQPELAKKPNIESAHSWNALVRAYMNHPKVQFAEVSRDDIATLGGFVAYLADGTELETQMLGKHPYIHYFDRKTDTGGAELDTGHVSTVDWLQDPYTLLEWVQDTGQAYICTVANGEGCSAAEVEYADVMSAKSGMERRKTLLSLKNQLKSDEAEDDPDVKSSLWQRVSILKQLVDGDPKKALPNKIYKEVYDPDDWKYPTMPAFVEKAHQAQDFETYVQLLLEPYLPEDVLEQQKATRKSLGDYIWEHAEAESDKDLPLMLEMKDKWFPERKEKRLAYEAAQKKKRAEMEAGARGDPMGDPMAAPAGEVPGRGLEL